MHSAPNCLNCKKMRGKIVSLEPRMLVQFTLFVTFFFLFGLPAIQRYMKKDVRIVETMKETKKIPVPAITFASGHQITQDICFQEMCRLKNALGKRPWKENTF